ncbi:MAG: hypothetical protein CMM16_03525 [Rhodospirillaceae bacterium]|nr:hypothetical protein [Rhodospirillaceae bacterium]MAI49623.1 hypothetical protein [Rhodospirillaceae bacterium]
MLFIPERLSDINPGPDKLGGDFNLNFSLSQEDRAENIHRVGEVAALIGCAGFVSGKNTIVWSHESRM